MKTADKNSLDILKTAIQNNNIIIGSKRAIKLLKSKDLKLIIVAKNCPENIKKDLEHYGKIKEIKVEEFEGDSKQLGVFCGKPFMISTIAVK